MKNILLIFAITVSSAAFAQGNLQFNQVINGSISGTVSTNGTAMGTIVVPTGKVLKIESVSFTYPQGAFHYPHSSSLSFVSINTHIVYVTANVPTPVLPLWFSEGTYTINARVTSNLSSTFSYSAIEFNVVP